MITIDFEKKEIHVSEDCSLDSLAKYLHELGENEDFKIYIDGVDTNTDTSG